jgi:hypothetical protein
VPAHDSFETNQQIGFPLLLADSPRNQLQQSQTLALSLLKDLGFFF